MNQKTWLILATALIGIGGILFAGVMMAQNWDFLKIQTTKFETNTYTVQDPYNNISINIDTTDLMILPTEKTETSVVCFEQEKVKHTVEVKDNTLSIQVVDTRAWYEHISIGFQSPKITVYLPQAEYGAVSVKASTADICMETLTAKTVDLALSTGDMTLTNIQCMNIKATATTGDIHLKQVIASQEFAVKNSTGDVILEGCDADRLKIETSTGDIKGWLLSPKVFLAHANTGSVSVPQTTEGGLCELHTNTGDIDVDALSVQVTAP